MSARTFKWLTVDKSVQSQLGSPVLSIQRSFSENSHVFMSIQTCGIWIRISFLLSHAWWLHQRPCCYWQLCHCRSSNTMESNFKGLVLLCHQLGAVESSLRMFSGIFWGRWSSMILTRSSTYTFSFEITIFWGMNLMCASLIYMV